MADIKPQLGQLDFDGVKDSIKSFLKTQNILKDVDYDSSAIGILLDTLAYNTLYYGYYANMIANEMFLDTAQKEESLVSLVKPLGYVIPGRLSSIGKVRVTQLGGKPEIPAYTRFSGKNAAGNNYNFYNVESIPVSTGETNEFSIFEGKTLIKENPLDVNLSSQKGFIFGLDIDINTIRVEVWNPNESEGEGSEAIGWEVWQRQGNSAVNLDATSKVYWIEREELGFSIVFGSNFNGTINNPLGQSIQTNNPVRISYLRSSGSVGNLVGNFTIDNAFSTDGSVFTPTISSGGQDGPNLESIRFYAPKWFSAQDRAVTVSDCAAVVSAFGIGANEADQDAVFSIWGGEDMTPPRYGRVFVSLSDAYINKRTEIIDVLKQKTCVSIIPEYVDNSLFRVNINANVPFNPYETSDDSTALTSKIINKLSENYPVKFKTDISSSKISNSINSIEDALNCSTDNIDLTIEKDITVDGTSSGSTTYFNNSLDNTMSIISSAFLSHPNIKGNSPLDAEVFLQIIGDPDSSGYHTVRAIYYNNGIAIQLTKNAAKINLENGTFILNDDIVRQNENITIVVKPGGQGSQRFRCFENMIPNFTYEINVFEDYFNL